MLTNLVFHQHFTRVYGKHIQLANGVKLAYFTNHVSVGCMVGISNYLRTSSWGLQSNTHILRYSKMAMDISFRDEFPNN